MSRNAARTALGALCAAALAAPPVHAQLAPSRRPAPLPAIPPATGPLAIHVVYPDSGAFIDATDSTFIFGSLGTGRAALTVDGQPVPVAPNGAFLGYVALPDSAAAVLRVVARAGADSAAVDVPIRLPPRPPARAGGAWLDPGSAVPRGAWWLPAGEPLRVSVRAADGARVLLRLPDGRTIPLAPDTTTAVLPGPFDRQPEAPRAPGTRYAGVLPARPLGGPLPAPLADGAPGPADTAALARLVVVVGTDTARAVLPLRLDTLAGGPPPVVVVGAGKSRAGAGDAVGMPGPGGPYHWLMADGTPAAVTGRSGDLIRLALSRESVAWVMREEVLGVLPAGTPPPAARAALVRLTAGPEAVRARVALTARVPYRVDEDGDNRLVLTLYSAVSDLDWVQYGSVDSTVRRISWAQPAADVVTVTFETARPVFGYRVGWDGTDLLLDIRRPPLVDRRHPLRGRLIAVDPGHPPGGATGPTGLREADANLAVALALRAILEREGARVVMTRTTDTALSLYQRVAVADSADADLLVSIHNNAFPDGVDPFANNGTSTYYYHARAARLAALIQQGLLSEMGLRDLGYGRGDLAMVRPTWMPAALSEGAFLMIPEQENALRTPSFQRAYARGVAIGIAAYLAERFGTPR